jgi:acetate---CoA ligase (ADP-forming)
MSKPSGKSQSLDAIFCPKSVAVIGASSSPGKVGHDIFVNILKGGFRGTLYPINPRATAIACVHCSASVLDIPELDLDLAIVILSPQAALKAVGEAIEKNVKGIVIVSAGFREVGEQGRVIEDKIASLCKGAGVRLVGPNCLGVINPQGSVRLNASFSTRMPKPGNGKRLSPIDLDLSIVFNSLFVALFVKVAFISQSGALCTAVLDFAADLDFGFSRFISIGNKADVDELDLLRYFHQDPETEVIIIYLEELRRTGEEFIQAVKEITSGDYNPTPILVIKSGRTADGAKAAASHTGALAGTEGVYDAIFRQAGIMRVDSIERLFDYATAFSCKNENREGKLSRKVPHGNRLAIVTNAGGPGIVGTPQS